MLSVGNLGVSKKTPVANQPRPPVTCLPHFKLARRNHQTTTEIVIIFNDDCRFSTSASSPRICIGSPYSPSQSNQSGASRAPKHTHKHKRYRNVPIFLQPLLGAASFGRQMDRAEGMQTWSCRNSVIFHYVLLNISS